MPSTFINDALKSSQRHRVVTEAGHYIMSESWIDTAQSNDMMDYDFTMSREDLRTLHEQIRKINIAVQMRHV
jgi:hypothetical protein